MTRRERKELLEIMDDYGYCLSVNGFKNMRKNKKSRYSVLNKAYQTGFKSKRLCSFWKIEKKGNFYRIIYQLKGEGQRKFKNVMTNLIGMGLTVFNDKETFGESNAVAKIYTA